MPDVEHFLRLRDLSTETLEAMVKRAIELKEREAKGDRPRVLDRAMLAMIFDKSSTRTRVSFETGMLQLGGGSMFLARSDLQLGRGEPLEDSARVISSMVDAVAIRTFEHSSLEEFAAASSVPVINALTDLHHPCQLLADVMTYEETRGPVRGKRVAWVGDGNNVCHSWMEAACLFGFDLDVACPEGYDPDPALVAECGQRVRIVRDAREAAEGAHLLVTDVWASMGQEDEAAKRRADLGAYAIDGALLAVADSGVAVMHCLPAHRGEEIESAVMDGPASVIWQEACNRLHAQKALLEYLMRGRPQRV